MWEQTSHDLWAGAIEANANEHSSKQGEQGERDGGGGDWKRFNCRRHANPRDQDLNGAKDEQSKDGFVVGWRVGWIRCGELSTHVTSLPVTVLNYLDPRLTWIGCRQWWLGPSWWRRRRRPTPAWHRYRWQYYTRRCNPLNIYLDEAALKVSLKTSHSVRIGLAWPIQYKMGH